MAVKPKHQPQPLIKNKDSTEKPSLDAIKIEYHPSSGLPSKIIDFEDYREQEEKIYKLGDNISEPWRPFRTRYDFEFAELIHETFATKDQTTRLIKLINENKSPNRNDGFTIQDYKDLEEIWEKASHLLSPV